MLNEIERLVSMFEEALKNYWCVFVCVGLLRFYCCGQIIFELDFHQILIPGGSNLLVFFPEKYRFYLIFRDHAVCRDRQPPRNIDYRA